jgi:hypothetical protein
MRWERVALLVVALLTASAAPAAATPRGAADPRAVRDWSVIAQRTIFTEGATPGPASTLYFGFVSVAVYDAVVAIEERYEPYTRQPRPARGASSQAAAVSAAYEVLRYYFPASAGALTADRAASLGAMEPGAARDRGVAAGRAAAAAMIRLRTGDGRGADITMPAGDRPGVWRPTPDAYAPMLVPWLGFVRPMLLRGTAQVPTPGPDPLTSARYARDFREVARLGARDGSERTPAQTETALFWSDNLVGQYQAALRDQAARRGLDIVESARMFAVQGASGADAAIACWRTKYDRAYWRPITAIREAGTDGNPATRADPDWTPLVPTPPYPDYVSGHACYTGATSHALSHLFGARHVDLRVASAVTGTTRHFATARALDAQTMDARILLGLHFRKAMTDGNRLGHDVSAYGVRHYFRPVR